MFIPFGFNQGFKGGAAAGFDPTLGGTLSPIHWWDMTDSSNITESGGYVTGIGDKGTSPEDLSTSNGWTFYNNGPTFTGNSIAFNDNVIYKYSTTWPGDMTSQGLPSTWVMIGQVDSSGVGAFAITGNRVGYEMLHQGFLYKNTSPARSTSWNNNNGATSTSQPNIFESFNKRSSNYGSFYSDVDIFAKNMYASYQYKSGVNHYIETSLNGLAFGGQTSTKSVTNSTTGYIAMGGSGLEVTFNRFSTNAFFGELSHIVVYYNQKLSTSELSALYATI